MLEAMPFLKTLSIQLPLGIGSYQEARGFLNILPVLPQWVPPSK
ncbi:hypothetical protein C4K04_1983 [Pseudomonas chlororaphis]|uniref:Uncharacterized protein n=1 Tax=Pseudomonas chlororaphis TaxID=587753 RepID=A0A3G7TKN3_9PSED|nr:hypothetical protein C4K04_1983 [Pseudomonas chlororaphis]